MIDTRAHLDANPRPYGSAVINCLTAAWLLAGAITAPVCRGEESLQPDPRIQKIVKEAVERERIPGLIAAIADGNGVRAIGAAGVRVAGGNTPITVNDVVHIGSCTKAMTCVMLAGLVAEGKLTWETTLTEVFPEWKAEIRESYHDVTLWQLVTHRSGMPANATDWWKYAHLPIRERRETLARENLTRPPAEKVGRYHYSNLGYMVAGCMAEKRSGMSWEALMTERVFRPLKMRTAGFGPPGHPQKDDQPWGHVFGNNRWIPRWFDNAEALGPAGTVHCSIEDWAKFVSLQLERKSTSILNRRQLDRLLKPTGEYAGGWIVTQRNWGSGTVLTHSGSNTMWYATVWVAPRINQAFFAVTNSCDDRSHKICDQVIAALIQLDRQTTTKPTSRATSEHRSK